MTKRVAVILVVLIVSMMVMTFEQQPVAKISNLTEATENNSKVSSTVNASILVDESHCATDTALWTPGNASRFGSLLMDYGYKVVMDFNTSLDSGILGSYDILMLFFPQIELTPSEISAVNDFVDHGGNLVLVGVDHRPTVSNYTAQPLNAISQTYGITFNDDAVYGRAQRSAGEITDHAVTYSVDSILSWAGNFLRSCTLTVSSPATTLITVKGGSFLAPNTIFVASLNLESIITRIKICKSNFSFISDINPILVQSFKLISIIVFFIRIEINCCKFKGKEIV